MTIVTDRTGPNCWKYCRKIGSVTSLGIPPTKSLQSSIESSVKSSGLRCGIVTRLAGGEGGGGGETEEEILLFEEIESSRKLSENL